MEEDQLEKSVKILSSTCFKVLFNSPIFFHCRHEKSRYRAFTFQTQWTCHLNKVELMIKKPCHFCNKFILEWYLCERYIKNKVHISRPYGHTALYCHIFILIFSIYCPWGKKRKILALEKTMAIIVKVWNRMMCFINSRIKNIRVTSVLGRLQKDHK